MTRYLAVADTVHDAAAICDYLAHRASGDDALLVVSGPASEDRDVDDALNVFRARLPGTTIEARSASDRPAASPIERARESDADEILVIGGSAETWIDRLLAGADCPVVVLPAT